MSQDNFILKPITSVFADAVNAVSGVGGRIEGFPVHDYMMQSLLMNAAGFQEQKFSALVWTLATRDLDYRDQFLRDEKRANYSRLDRKAPVLKTLLKRLGEIDFYNEGKKSVAADVFERNGWHYSS